jgi:betaine reductase
MPRSDYPVLRATRYLLVHAPHLVRYGSKPSRELAKNARLQEQLDQHSRSYEDALAYAPNRFS